MTRKFHFHSTHLFTIASKQSIKKTQMYEKRICDTWWCSLLEYQNAWLWRFILLSWLNRMRKSTALVWLCLSVVDARLTFSRFFSAFWLMTQTHIVAFGLGYGDEIVWLRGVSVTPGFWRVHAGFRYT